MSFTSGTVKSINEFMDTFSTFAVANESWVILDGSENNGDSGVFPFNSRYLRIEFSNPLSTTFGGVEVAQLELRATAAGADLGFDETDLQFFSGESAGFEVANLFDGNRANRWDPTVSDNALLEFDFGVDTTIREIVVGSSDTTVGGQEAPRDITISRSEDGVFWDPIHNITGLSWANNEAKVLTFPADATNFATSTATGGVRRPCQYVLQAPGYDAERRVYVGFQLFQDFSDGNQGFRMQGYTGYDVNLDFDNQLQAIPFENTPAFVIDNTTEDLDYWLYVNSTRAIGVIRSGAGDYAMFYAGFLAAFPNPDQHPNPLYIAGTSPQIGDSSNFDFLLWNEADSRNSAFWDPGSLGGLHLDYKGDWMFIGNNRTTSALGRYPIIEISTGRGFIQPWHIGAAGSPNSGTFPFIGDQVDVNGDHFLKRQIVTLQDELPTFDAIVESRDYGHIGTLQGTIAVPGASSLVPEQTITVGGVTYRIFPKRTVRDDAQWVGIAEQ